MYADFQLYSRVHAAHALFSFPSSSQFNDYHLKLELLKSSLDKLRDTKPRIDNGLFVRLILGRVNMALWKQADRINFKDEYNKFKSRTTMQFILYPAIQLIALFFFPQFWSQHGDLALKLHQCWLLYYYLTLSLRENILLVNGSDILHWWIYHHYVSMLISLVMLLFPSRYILEGRVVEMLTFGLVQGLVMFFQNNYQKKRLYTRKALGKAKAIDVDSTETLVEKPTDLKILIPMLFFLYLMEFYFGFGLISDFMSRRNIEYPVSILVLGACFLVLGVGNAYTTGIVLVSKSKARNLKQAVQERVTGRNARASSTSSSPPNIGKKHA